MYSIYVPKANALLISCMVIAQLICAFVFAYVKARFSHGMTQITSHCDAIVHLRMLCHWTLTMHWYLTRTCQREVKTTCKLNSSMRCKVIMRTQQPTKCLKPFQKLCARQNRFKPFKGSFCSGSLLLVLVSASVTFHFKYVQIVFSSV